MKNIKSFIVAVVLGSALLVGCDDSESVQNQRYQQTPNQMVDEQYVNQPAPQVVQAAPAQPSTVVVQGGGSGSSGVGEFATGMLLGHMLSGNSGGGGGYRDGGSNTTIINNNAAPTTNSKAYTTQKHSFYDKQGNTYTTTKQNTIKQQSVQTYSRPSTTKVNSNYSARKSYSSPISSYSKSSKSYSSSKRSFSSSRRR